MRLAVRSNTDKYRESFIDTKHTISINWDGIGDWKDSLPFKQMKIY